MDCSCMINFNRSTSLCLTNDTDWQVHVSTNFEYNTVSKLTSFKILGVVNTTQDDPCRSNSGGSRPLSRRWRLWIQMSHIAWVNLVCVCVCLSFCLSVCLLLIYHRKWCKTADLIKLSFGLTLWAKGTMTARWRHSIAASVSTCTRNPYMVPLCANTNLPSLTWDSRIFDESRSRSHSAQWKSHAFSCSTKNNIFNVISVLLLWWEMRVLTPVLLLLTLG